jgi:hypothetical protein
VLIIMAAEADAGADACEEEDVEIDPSVAMLLFARIL